MAPISSLHRLLIITASSSISYHVDFTNPMQLHLISSCYRKLITYVIARSNPKRSFSFYASSNGSHYQVTMTFHNDPRTWCHNRKVRFLLKRQTSGRTTPRTSAFITLRDDRHVWTGRNSLTGIDRQWVRRKFGKIFLHKLHLKSIQNVWIAVINV